MFNACAPTLWCRRIGSLHSHSHCAAFTSGALTHLKKECTVLRLPAEHSPTWMLEEGMHCAAFTSGALTHLNAWRRNALCCVHQRSTHPLEEGMLEPPHQLNRKVVWCIEHVHPCQDMCHRFSEAAAHKLIVLQADGCTDRKWHGQLEEGTWRVRGIWPSNCGLGDAAVATFKKVELVEVQGPCHPGSTACSLGAGQKPLPADKSSFKRAL